MNQDATPITARLVGRSLLVLASVATLASACSDGGEPASAAEDTASVVVTMSDYAIEAPDTLREGWTTFHVMNNGQDLHAPLLVRLDQGRTVDEFREAYAEAWENGGSFGALGLLGGIVAPPPGASSSATLHLEPGRYAWYCPMHWEGGYPHVIEHEMASPFVVTESRDGALVPAPDPSVTITMVDYAYALSAPLTAGHHVIRVENEGAEGHEVVLMKMALGATLDDVEAWIENPVSPPPFTSSLGGVVLEENGASEGYFEVELTEGDYVLYCTINAPDGRPHTEHGMIHVVRIG